MMTLVNDYILIMQGYDWKLLMFKNIAKGTTDPRVEFISQDHSSQLINLEHIPFQNLD